MLTEAGENRQHSADEIIYATKMTSIFSGFLLRHIDTAKQLSQVVQTHIMWYNFVSIYACAWQY